MDKGKITLSLKERNRLRLIHEVEKGYISGVEAVEALVISSRHFKRIRKRRR